MKLMRLFLISLIVVLSLGIVLSFGATGPVLAAEVPGGAAAGDEAGQNADDESGQAAGEGLEQAGEGQNEAELNEETQLLRIEELQELLSKAGYSISVDGEFGDETNTALIQYCDQNEIPHEDIPLQDLIDSVIKKIQSTPEEDLPQQAESEESVAVDEPGDPNAAGSSENPSESEQVTLHTSSSEDTSVNDPLSGEGADAGNADLQAEETEGLSEAGGLNPEGIPILIDPPEGKKTGIIYAEKDENGEWHAVHDFYVESPIFLIILCAVILLIAIGIFIVGILLVNKIRR